MPTRRGKASGHNASWRNTWKREKRCSNRSAGRRPNRARPSAGHRDPPSSGGSDTINRPPVARSGAAHSAVTAGGPKLRATTRLALPRHSGFRPASSARVRATTTWEEMPSSLMARARNDVRRSLLSRRAMAASGHASASTNPGSPAPLPRSTTRAGSCVPTASRNPSACSRCPSTGPGPRNPSARASSRMARRDAATTSAAAIRPVGSRRAGEAPRPPMPLPRRRCCSPCRGPPCDRRPASVPGPCVGPFPGLARQSLA